MDLKRDFAKRLRNAMEDAGMSVRPSVLLNHFDSRYWGRPVSFQAVSRWLRGEAIPEQDKLVVLASLLRVEPEVLRFGESFRLTLRESDRRWEQGVGYTERETFDAFLQLPVEQKRLIRETIMIFAKANTCDPALKQPKAAPQKGTRRRDGATEFA
jgi:transcriptional regulator with XRE-family HTH domain